MCNYCENRKSIYKDADIEVRISPYYIQDNHLLITNSIDDDTETETDFKIKYCPMCGKQLNDN